MNSTRTVRNALLAAALLVVAACTGDDEVDGGNESEIITTVTLTFTPAGGGAAILAAFDDPDGDGGAAPSIDPVQLGAGSYELAVRFENRLESPAEDITEEIRDEADEHQVFFTGTAVNGPASDRPGAPLSHGYADTDAGGNPIGLRNTIGATSGTGQLTVTLRHLPPVNQVPAKTAEAAAQVRSGGFSAIGGSTDAQVDFGVTVP